MAFTASLDKTVAAKGATLTLTVAFAGQSTLTVTGVGPDGKTLTIINTVIAQDVDPNAVSVTDDSGRKWTKVTATPTTVVYTAIA